MSFIFLQKKYPFCVVVIITVQFIYYWCSYDVMLSCWEQEPQSRPSFVDLQQRLRQMLRNDIAQHYVELNGPYIQMNAMKFGNGAIDYLAAPAPLYGNVPNGMIPGYCSMSPIHNQNNKGSLKDINGTMAPPRDTDLSMKNDHNRQRTPEEIPMLKPDSNNDSECDLPNDTGTSRRHNVIESAT